MDTAEPLHVVRPALAASRGWALITNTPKGVSNYFTEIWKSAVTDPAWWCSSRTIEETVDLDGEAIIPLTPSKSIGRRAQPAAANAPAV